MRARFGSQRGVVLLRAGAADEWHVEWRAFVIDGREVVLEAAGVPTVHAYVDGSVIDVIVAEKDGVQKTVLIRRGSSGDSGDSYRRAHGGVNDHTNLEESPDNGIRVRDSVNLSRGKATASAEFGGTSNCEFRSMRPLELAPGRTSPLLYRTSSRARYPQHLVARLLQPRYSEVIPWFPGFASGNEKGIR